MLPVCRARQGKYCSILNNEQNLSDISFSCADIADQPAGIFPLIKSYDEKFLMLARACSSCQYPHLNPEIKINTIFSI